MRPRVPIAIVLAALSCAALAGCRTNVGVAARVNGETISESRVNSYLGESGPDAALVEQARNAGQELPSARVLVLESEIDNKLYERALERNGGRPSEARLAGLRDRAFAALIGNGRVADDKQVSTQLAKYGVTRDFTGRYLRALELEYVLISRLKLSQIAELRRVVAKAGAKVSVNPRYGQWDAAQQALNGTAAAGLPSFLKLQPTGSAQPSSSAPPAK